jgi:hypothetical protein
MIIANVPDPHNKGEALTVEVTNTLTAGGRKLAEVRALAGQPFTAWTNGGWAESDTAYIPVAFLADVAVSVALAGDLIPAGVLTETH